MEREIVTVFKSLNYTPPQEEMLRSLRFFSAERSDVRNMMEKLRWDEPEEVQQSAVNYLAKNLLPCEFIYLVMPGKYTALEKNNQVIYYKQTADKSRWENAAKTILKIGWPKLDHIIVPLFIWLLDPNWPGSETIFNLILTLPKNVLAAKMTEIMNNPQNYSKIDHTELKELINEICQELGIIL